VADEQEQAATGQPNDHQPTDYQKLFYDKLVPTSSPPRLFNGHFHPDLVGRPYRYFSTSGYAVNPYRGVPWPVEEAAPPRSYASMLDRAVEYVGEPLPEGYDSWAVKSTRPDLVTRHGFRWPAAGEVKCDQDRVATSNIDPCPWRPGDGLCLASNWRGMASGGFVARTLLLVAYRWVDVLGRDQDKIRVRRAVVVRAVDGEALVREHAAGADLTGANLDGMQLGSANLVGTNLTGAMMSRTDLRGANLKGADLTGATMIGADLSRAFLDDCRMTGADTRRADFSFNEMTRKYGP
jgi:hypothetical protein